MNDSLSQLISDAPQGRHFCQLHHRPESLDAAVNVFVETGLNRGHATIVIASAARNARIRNHLEHAGLDCAALEGAKQLMLLDAGDVLSGFMNGDMPVWKDFRRKIGRIVDSVKESSGGKIRLFGEMVNDLWREGNPAAAIRLEEYWNDLAREYSFCLFCGYELNGLDDDSYAGPVHQIAAQHTDIPATADDVRFLAALEAASNDVLGISLSAMLSLSGSRTQTGEHRLPIVYRTVLWLQRHMPSSMTKVLRRARFHYADMTNGTS
ncbi:MAG TPA: MEDS domain-containing protein [Gammaproteobacteria bacterium]